MTSPTLPKITVITPSYNQGRYLEQTIHSIVSQGYPNLEYIVVDGGSRDNSVEIIRKYEKHLAWWVSEKDKGQTDALNKGYARATGDVCCFVNSDDVLEPGSLHYAARQFTDGAERVDWIVGWAKYFDDDGDEWYYPPKEMRRPVDWLVGNPVPQIASFWRTGVRDKVGPFAEQYHWSFDYEYWLRMYFRGGYRPRVVRRCLGGFRLQPNSKTCSRPANFGVENKALYDEYGKFLTPAQRAHVRREMKRKVNRQLQTRAWIAIKQGDPLEARKHAVAAVTDLPTSLEAWKTAYFALRGY